MTTGRRIRYVKKQKKKIIRISPASIEENILIHGLYFELNMND